MYHVYLYASDPTAKPGEFKPGSLQSFEGRQGAEDALRKALAELPTGGEPSIESHGDEGVLIQGDAALPHADAVVQAAHAYYLAVRGERKSPPLALTGYVVDQAGITQISTPVAPPA